MAVVVLLPLVPPCVRVCLGGRVCVWSCVRLGCACACVVRVCVRVCVCVRGRVPFAGSLGWSGSGLLGVRLGGGVWLGCWPVPADGSGWRLLRVVVHIFGLCRACSF